jgi:hypothetical protein
MALLGLALLLGGGAYLWLTGTGGCGWLPGNSPLADGKKSGRVAGDVLSSTVEGDEDALEWFLAGSEGPDGVKELEPVPRSQPEPVRRSQAAGVHPTTGNGELGAGKRPFDWQTEPGSHLA